ncbi:O-methyltransferase [Amycolatopsis sp. NPDC026612]|uniref:O-methyltransferase n=1 Tax=Amycolatopsis sp. NPDC026612 TaxID=3155466 RepID=UPI003411B90A
MATMSYESRPSKTVVRRVFFESLRHLKVIAAFADYQYVGFGALEFIDFDMAHRSLGIESMVSIERDVHIERYEWNRPFNGIDILSGTSSDILPTLDWSRLSIVWLDYTDTLNKEVIRDVEMLLRVLIPGSVLAVTVNAHPVHLGERVEALNSAIGPDRVPLRMTESRLGGWGMAEVQWEVLNSAISETMSSRGDGTNWNQILNLRYQDAAKMQMIVGVVGSDDFRETLDSCRFEELAELRREDDALVVNVPMLTRRERDWINQRLPAVGAVADISLPGVKVREIDDYKRIYRWLEATS